MKLRKQTRSKHAAATYCQLQLLYRHTPEQILTSDITLSLLGLNFLYPHQQMASDCELLPVPLATSSWINAPSDWGDSRKRKLHSTLPYWRSAYFGNHSYSGKIFKLVKAPILQTGNLLTSVLLSVPARSWCLHNARTTTGSPTSLLCTNGGPSMGGGYSLYEPLRTLHRTTVCQWRRSATTYDHCQQSKQWRWRRRQSEGLLLLVVCSFSGYHFKF